jgi:outer membrane protein assembly factor BamB
MKWIIQRQSLTRRATFAVIAGIGISAATAQADDRQDWRYWRGNSAQGVAPSGAYPVAWDVEQDAAWKIKIPGDGGSTPVVVGDLVMVTHGYEGKNHLTAYRADSGEMAWDTTLGDDTGGKHKKGSGSNPSPTTDGQHVFAYYRSGDLACVDLTGNVVWQRNLQQEFGEDTLWWDLGSSPVLTDSDIVVAAMQSPPSPSYVAGFNKSTGDLSWRVDRELGAPKEAAQSYTSPLTTTIDGQAIIAVLGADHLTLHSAEDGKELARLGGFNPGQEQFFRSIASPVIDGNIIICPYSRGSTLTAVDMRKLLAGAGRDAIVWHHEGQGADVPTPATRDGKLYLCGDRGEVSVLDVQTGETLWQVVIPRHRSDYSSSPLVTDSHLYLTRENGSVIVIALPESEGAKSIVATNELGDDSQYTVASPVPLGDAILFRTAGTLIKIGG